MSIDGPLRGRVGLITGGGGGIGRACAFATSEAGARVFVLDREPKARGVLDEELSRRKPDAMYVAADVADAAAVESAFQTCIGHYGQIDFVICAAGIGCAGTIGDGDANSWWPTLETNVLGVMHTARSAFAHMRAGGGDLLVLGSVSGLETYIGEDIYLASKWAVTGLTYALRHEGRELGIRVCLLAPGLVDTPLARSNPFGQQMFAQQGASLRPEDVANAAVFALSRPRHAAVNDMTLRPFGQRL
jgi:NADP-dependent 3-hydroxy acid dehydrogenase YdfG